MKPNQGRRRNSMRGGRARNDGRTNTTWIPQAASSNQSAEPNERVVLTTSNMVTYGQRWKKETREDLLIINGSFFTAVDNLTPTAVAVDAVVAGADGLLPMPVIPVFASAPATAQEDRDQTWARNTFNMSY